jgi:hypothetical protein
MHRLARPLAAATLFLSLAVSLPLGAQDGNQAGPVDRLAADPDKKDEFDFWDLLLSGIFGLGGGSIFAIGGGRSPGDMKFAAAPFTNHRPSLQFAVKSDGPAIRRFAVMKGVDPQSVSVTSIFLFINTTNLSPDQHTRFFVGTTAGAFVQQGDDHIFLPTGLPAGAPVNRWYGAFSDPRHVFARVGADIYLSTDLGTTFQKTSGLPTTPGVLLLSALAYPSPNDSIVLAGLNAGGLFRSTNGGLTFTALPGFSSGTAGYVFGFSGSTAFAGTSKGVWMSMDLGLTWTAVNNGLPSGAFGSLITALAVGGNTLYAGSYLPPGVWKSTDGAASWSQASNGITASLFNALLITDFGVVLATNAGLFLTTDGGANWGPFNGTQPTTRIGTLALSAGRLYAGTTGSYSGVYTSTDSGKSMTPADSSMAGVFVGGLAPVPGAVVAAAVQWQFNGPLWGMFRSTNDGLSWTESNSGIPVAQGYFPNTAVAVGTRVVAAVATNAPGSNVYKSDDGGGTWSGSTGVTTSIGLLAPSGNTVLGTSQFTGGTIVRSTNRGDSFTNVGTIDSSFTATFTALALSGSTAFLGLTDSASPAKSGLYKSPDAGNTWSLLPTPAAKNGQAPSAITTADGTTVYIGYASGGLYRSTDGGSTWALLDKLTGPGPLPVGSLLLDGTTLYVGTLGLGLQVYDVSPRTTRTLPFAGDVISQGGLAHFTTEADVTNKSSGPVTVSFLYTPSLGTKEGAGTVTDTIPPGQKIYPDLIAFFRTKGLAIPSASVRQQGGAVQMTFDGVATPDLVNVVAKTTSATAAPQPVGSAGLAYAALRPRDAIPSAARIYGLRANAADRSNFTVFNSSADSVTLQVSAYSGAGDGATAAVDDALTLGPFGWKQYSLAGDAGLSNGFAVVERTAGVGTFGAYGVANDQTTQDASYASPVFGTFLSGYVLLPVLVESPTQASELTVTNAGFQAATLQLVYKESSSPAGGAGGTAQMTLQPNEQRIIPDAIDYLRGLAGITLGAKGANTYAGSLRVNVSGAPLGDVYVGARIGFASPAGGQFALFAPTVYPGAEAVTEAFLYGLRSDATNRTNVAAINTGVASDGPVTLSLQAYDGDNGGQAKGAPLTVTLAPGEWHQFGDATFLRAVGVANGWVKVSLVSGTAPWITYASNNDGSVPGARTGDGAYIGMTTD